MFTRSAASKPEYVEAMMSDGDGIWWESSWEERRNRITFRLERQKLIMEADPAKAMHFVITELDLLVTKKGLENLVAVARAALCALEPSATAD